MNKWRRDRRIAMHRCNSCPHQKLQKLKATVWGKEKKGWVRGYKQTLSKICGLYSVHCVNSGRQKEELEREGGDYVPNPMYR